MSVHSDDFTDQEAVAAILRITGGNIRLIRNYSKSGAEFGHNSVENSTSQSSFSHLYGPLCRKEQRKGQSSRPNLVGESFCMKVRGKEMTDGEQ